MARRRNAGLVWGGKDPSEARLKGLDLRAWVVVGIFTTFERFERFCIQTVDCGLSDAEAIKGCRPAEEKRRRRGPSTSLQNFTK
jgi:hypothetical protein